VLDKSVRSTKNTRAAFHSFAILSPLCLLEQGREAPFEGALPRGEGA
jgi:hypothetical protein